jgi:hypothetical protein
MSTRRALRGCSCRTPGNTANCVVAAAMTPSQLNPLRRLSIDQAVDEPWLGKALLIFATRIGKLRNPDRLCGNLDAPRALSRQAADGQASVGKRVDFSIIVCTRNRRDALKSCLDSIAMSMSSVSDMSKEI